MINEQKKQSKKIIIGVLAVFFVPMIMAMILFYFHNYFHLAKTNRGQLLQPVLNNTALYKKIAGSQPRWIILHSMDKSCDTTCLALKDTLQQVRMALGKASQRVVVETMSYAEFLKFFPQTKKNKALLITGIYLIDPAANVLMFYPNKTDPMDILRDLKHLLEVSQIG